MADKVEITDKGGNTMNLRTLEGRLYPLVFPEESLRNVFNFKARPDDILLCTYPKSGTHWLSEILRLLVLENPTTSTTSTTTAATSAATSTSAVASSSAAAAGEGVDGTPTRVFAMIDFAPPSAFESMPAPRCLTTHASFDDLSPEFVRQGCKTILVVRDPRDVAVSFFHHHAKLKQVYEYQGEWKDYFHLQLDGQVDYGCWFAHTKSWERGMRDHPDHPVLVLSFEDMKRDPLAGVRKLASFLDVESDEEFLTQVVAKTSFQFMKEKFSKDKVEAVMYRKGEAGDWKNYFTVAMAEMFDQKFEQEMAGTDAYRLYSSTLQDN